MNGDLEPSTKTWLVEQAERTLDRVQSENDFRGQTSQLRNLLQIVQSESEIPVLRNFIRYQTGRKATKKFWQLIHTDVIRMLMEIGDNFPDEAKRRTALRSFFGYLVRHYVYLSEAAPAGARPGRPARN